MYIVPQFCARRWFVGPCRIQYSVGCNSLSLPEIPGGWINIKMSSDQYKKSHCGDKTILRPSYLHNGISNTGKTASLYWIRALLLGLKSSNMPLQLHWMWLFVNMFALSVYLSIYPLSCTCRYIRHNTGLAWENVHHIFIWIHLYFHLWIISHHDTELRCWAMFVHW